MEFGCIEFLSCLSVTLHIHAGHMRKAEWISRAVLANCDMGVVKFYLSWHTILIRYIHIWIIFNASSLYMQSLAIFSSLSSCSVQIAFLYDFRDITSHIIYKSWCLLCRYQTWMWYFKNICFREVIPIFFPNDPDCHLWPTYLNSLFNLCHYFWTNAYARSVRNTKSWITVNGFSFFWQWMVLNNLKQEQVSDHKTSSSTSIWSVPWHIPAWEAYC